MTHTDAWTGSDIQGKAVILTTTEGPEIIDGERLRQTANAGDLIARLTARVEELESAVRELSAPQPDPEPADDDASDAAKPAQKATSTTARRSGK